LNYYERHIGDYLKDTAHLSLLEHGIYSRLLDVYYTRESAIPEAEADRLVGARSKEERAAVKAVLKEFFQLDAGAWRQDRCDREIARFQDKQEKARRSAEARWSDSGRNANAFQSGDAQPMRTHSEGNATRAPVPRLQTPDTSMERGAAKSLRPTRKAPPDFDLTPERLLWAKAHAPGVDVKAETEKFRDHTFKTAISDWDGAWRNWLRKAQDFKPRLAQVNAFEGAL
jgi:uncharacterized protein YdaU (DUF1376 family)